MGSHLRGIQLMRHPPVLPGPASSGGGSLPGYLAHTNLATRIRVGRRLFDLGPLDCQFDEEHHTLWTFMTPAERPNYNEPMLRDFELWQSEIVRTLGDPATGLRYLILGSRF